jgi:hypothetical protein
MYSRSIHLTQTNHSQSFAVTNYCVQQANFNEPGADEEIRTLDFNLGKAANQNIKR